MKRLFTIFALLAASLFQVEAHNFDDFNCFAVLAGRHATTDGSVLLAHNEDDSGEQMLNIYTVPRNEQKGTSKYLWIEFPGMKVADAALNEYGVAVVSDACRSREDRADVTDGGVVYEVRKTVAKYARSARHGVELIKELMEKRGYADSGRTYIIADSREGWICSLVRGRHWVAQRVPDDQVMIIPNNYCITEVNLEDTANFMGSPDLISYAVERGWYNPETDGTFSFKKVYSNPNTLHSDRNYIRHMSALNLITGKNYTTDPNTYPFSVKANRKIGINDLIEVLGSHGDNVIVKTQHKKAPLHPSCICVDRTINASIFQLRNWLPTEIGSLIWTTGGRPCYELFVPWYVGMSKSPEGFQRFATVEEAEAKHFSDAKNMRASYPEAAAWKFISFWEWLISDYNKYIGATKNATHKLQQEIFKQQTEFEAVFVNLYDSKTKIVTERAKLEKRLNNYTASWYDRYFKTLEKIKKSQK